MELEAAGAVSGVVTGPGGVPAPGVAVRAYADGDTWLGSGAATTAADGTYAIEGLAPGSYRISFAPPAGSGLVTEWYDGTPSRAAATPVTLPPGGPVADVDAELAGAGSVSGVVTGPGGVPAPRVAVWAYAEGDTWLGSAVATTTADGSYVIEGLRTGSYRIRFVPPAASGLAVRWYDGATTRVLATPVPAGTVDVDAALP